MKINKKYGVSIVILSTIFFVAACGSDEIVKPNASNTLSFDVEVLESAELNPQCSEQKRSRAVVSSPEEGGEGLFLHEHIEPAFLTMPRTRGTLLSAIDGDFSLFADKGNTEWFYNEKVDKNGKLEHDYYARSGSGNVCFYAVYPYQTDWGYPDISFHVSEDVKSQTDLLVAKPKTISFADLKKNSEVPLTFKHALTAVRFNVGNNITSGDSKKKLKELVVKNVITEGTYNLKNQSWTLGSKKKDFTFSLDASTSTQEGTPLVTGDLTLLMLPQDARQCKVVLYFSDNTHLTFTPKTPWQASTTLTYSISSVPKGYSFHLKAEPKSKTVDFESTSFPYQVESYVQNDITNATRPMKWKVVGYKRKGDTDFSLENKPYWFNLDESALQGEGAEKGSWNEKSIALKPTIKDKKVEIDDKLKNNSPLGTEANPYDLSKHDINGAACKRSTANTYLVSAPGWYKIPLVYGNAIKAGKTNWNAFWIDKSSYKYCYFASYENAVRHVKRPPIYYVDGLGVWKWYIPTNSEVTWTTVNNLVNKLSLIKAKSTKDPSDEDEGYNDDTHIGFLKFQVTKENMEQGVAVLSVRSDYKSIWGDWSVSNPVLWSWTIWVAPKEALQKVKVKNNDKTYTFSKYPLGWYYKEYKYSYYEENGDDQHSPRTVEVLVEQVGGLHVKDTLTVVQDAGERIEGHMTVYQWGRKDAMLRDEWLVDIEQNPFEKASAKGEIGYGISHPKTIYDTSGQWCTNSLNYLWDAKNINGGKGSTPSVKSIYDPCPVGFAIPSNDEFSFTDTKEHLWAEAYAPYGRVNGYYFKTNYTADGNPYYIFIPACYGTKGKKYGRYWFSYPKSDDASYSFYINKTSVVQNQIRYRSSRLGIFPIAKD